MSLTNQRELFDIPDQITYLNCAYVSPPLRAVREAGQGSHCAQAFALAHRRARLL